MEQRREVTSIALNLPPIAEPGSKAIYSNVGWAIAGYIAETAAGKPYEGLLEEKLFRPLGMETARSGGWPASTDEPDQPRGHYPEKSPWPQPLEDEYTFPDWMNPAGGVHCSITDFAAYARENLAGLKGEDRLLDRAGYEKLHSIQLTVPYKEMYLDSRDNSELNLGYGWAISPDAWANLSMASGSGGTFLAMIAVYPAQDAGFVGFTNSGDGASVLQ